MAHTGRGSSHSACGRWGRGDKDTIFANPEGSVGAEEGTEGTVTCPDSHACGYGHPGRGMRSQEPGQGGPSSCPTWGHSVGDKRAELVPAGSQSPLGCTWRRSGFTPMTTNCLWTVSLSRPSPQPGTLGCAAAGAHRAGFALRGAGFMARHETWAPGAVEGVAWPRPRGLERGQLVLEQVGCLFPLPGHRLAPCPALALAPNQSGDGSGTAESSAAGTQGPRMPRCPERRASGAQLPGAGATLPLPPRHLLPYPCCPC